MDLGKISLRGRGLGRPHADEEEGNRETARIWCPSCTPNGKICSPTLSAAPRRPPPASSGCAPWPRKVLHISHRRRQRRADQAPLRQPLRHRPEHARRHHPRHQHSAGRQEFVVAGYGWCGTRLAMRARGMGADVIVTEMDPLKALEAAMDGFRVMPMDEAAPIGDIFVTVTGDNHVIARRAFRADEGRRHRLPTPATSTSRSISRRWRRCRPARREAREFVEEFAMRDGKRIYVLGEGRLINLAAAEGPSGARDGHELRQPGAVRRVHGEEPRHAGEACLRRA